MQARDGSQDDSDYRRDRTTWAAFGALFAFGFVLSSLGPALPYLRDIEGISYFVGALHQAAFAVGGGIAGLLAARERRPLERSFVISTGLAGAALAGLAVGYGTSPVVTIGGALLMSLLGTSALIRVWAVVADVHGSRRAVAMTEGEVAVSLAGILTPLLIGALAATVLSWRFAFVLGAVATWTACLWVRRVGMPPPAGRTPEPPGAAAASGPHRIDPTLVVVFAIVALEFSLSFWLASYLTDEIDVHRDAAAAAVGGLYAANLAGRLLASRLARHLAVERLLAAALATTLLGCPILLLATGVAAAGTGIAITGIGIGALFPLTSSLYVEATPRSADSALGQILAVASVGQIAGPLAAGAIAEAADLRTGLVVLPALALMAAASFALRSAPTPPGGGVVLPSGGQSPPSDSNR